MVDQKKVSPQTQFEQFIDTLFAADDLIEIRCIEHTENAGKGHVKQEWYLPKDAKAAWPRLNDWNTKPRVNIYAGVCARSRKGGKKKDVKHGRVLWADLDHVSPEEATQRAGSAGLPLPTMTINSGHGAHIYWKLESLVAPANLEALVGDLAVYINGDKSVKDSSRVMRAPGFQNKKPDMEPAPCHIVSYRPAANYEFKTLRKVIPKAETQRHHSAAPQELSEERQEIISRAMAYVAKAEGVTEGNRNPAAFKLGCALRNDFGLTRDEAWQIIVSWNCLKNRPPLGEGELGKVLDNAGMYAQREPLRLANATPSAQVRPSPSGQLPFPGESGALDELRARP